MELPGKKFIFPIGIGIILILTYLVFRAVPGFDFVNWDDMIYVYENPWIQEWSLKNLMHIWFHFLPKENYHPLVFMTYLVEYSIAGLNPGVYHVGNLIFHLANVLLLLYWLRLWNKGMIVPLLTALIFAIHPLHVETVCWISDRKDLLMTFFTLLCLIQYHFMRRGKGSQGLLFLFFMAALFSKTSAAVIPLVFFILDEYIYTEPTNNSIWIRLKNQLTEKWVYWLIAVMFTLVVAYAQKRTGGIHEGGITGLQWIWRPFLNISVAFLFYLKKSILPLHLINQYFGLLHATVWGMPVAVIAPIVFVLLGLGVLFSSYFTWKIRFAFLLTFGISIPYLQWVPLGHSLVWDRYFYLGSIGFFWLFAQGIEWIWNRYQGIAARGFVALAVLGIVAFWGNIAYKQTWHWENGISLWKSNLKRQPSNLQALQNLYRAYKAKGIKDQRMLKVLKRGLSMHSTDFVLNQGIGEYYFAKGEYLLAKKHFTESILDYQTNRDVYYLLALTNLQLKDTAGYQEQLRIAAFMGHTQAKLEQAIKFK
jgi:protein O-mannosyl-transferase